MSTFVAIDDKFICEQIFVARRRIVFIAPGLSSIVAEAIGEKLRRIDDIDVTVILDPSEDVCRVGYGELNGLQLIHQLALANGFAVREQAGLRIGVLLSDDAVFVWTPTPRSIEETPSTDDQPNGLALGTATNAVEAIAFAAAVEGANTTMAKAEIGKSGVKPTTVEAVAKGLQENPPVPVDLARTTRVFNTQFQFIQIEIKNANISKREFSIPSTLLNADAAKELQGLLDAKLKAFSEFKDIEISVPAYSADGEAVYDRQGNQIKERVTEAILGRRRREIESDVYSIKGFGNIIARKKKALLEARLKALTSQLQEHAKGVQAHIESRKDEIVEELANLIFTRYATAGIEPGFVYEDLQCELRDLLDCTIKAPEVSTIFKDITYEQTKDRRFQELLKAAIPPHKFKEITGNNDKGWFTENNAVLGQSQRVLPL